MEIETRKIREMLLDILNKIEKEGIDKISLDEDYYWHIPSDEIYQVDKKPSELNLGQLYEDYEMLTKYKNEYDLICYDLKKLSSLLRYIADKNTISS